MEFGLRDEMTYSVCPECLRRIPAFIVDTEAGATMVKECADHGEFVARVGSSLSSYRDLRRMNGQRVTRASRLRGSGKGCPDDCGLCSNHGQRTCMAVVDITSRCDLVCPVCLTGSVAEGSDVPVTAVESMLGTFVRERGGPTPLQLSGGEPTLHPELMEVVRTAVRLGFTRIEVNTNGLALAQDSALAEKLKEAGLSGVYLQFDGLEAGVSVAIRGADLVEQKLQAIENCKASGLQVVLAVTVVPGVNDHLLWELSRFAVLQGMTGIMFQPFTLSGRFPAQWQRHSRNRLTLSHFFHGMDTQSDGCIATSDFIPIPCPDVRCAAIAYIVVYHGKIVPLVRVLGASLVSKFAASLADWDSVLKMKRFVECFPVAQNDIIDVGSEKHMGSGTVDFVSIGFHAMMDCWDFDVERVCICCSHALSPGKRVMPLCLYNMKYRKGAVLPSVPEDVVPDCRPFSREWIGDVGRAGHSLTSSGG